MSGIKNKIKLTYEESHRINNGILEKLCNRCLDWFPCTEEYFYKTNIETPDNLFPYCKECNIKRSAKWKEEHPNEVKISMNKTNSKPKRKQQIKESEKRRRETGKYREWQRSEKGKLSTQKSIMKRKPKKHIMTIKEWESCKKYFIHRCAYCGLPIEEHWVQVRGNIQLGDFHKEHIIDDGRNDIKNCVPSCKSCNSEKNGMALNEWYNPINPKYNQERYHRMYMWIRFDCKKYIMPKKKKKNQIKR